jgi:Flp pilus assembly protein TadG
VHDVRRSSKRCEGDAGTSLVEMAFMIAPLCLFLFGIVVYGYLMSFRQNMTQAAAEGARAGAIAPPDATSATHVKAINQATFSTRKALSSFGEDCDNGRTTCTVVVLPCPTSPPPPNTINCVTVTVDYDYEHHPLMPDIPIVSGAIPGTFTSSSTAQINT